MADGPGLKQLLTAPEITVAPGIYDALGAALVQQAGFEVAYLSGASIAYTRLGRPDIGLVGMSEVADTLSMIFERTGMKVIVDADTGFGNALNVMRTVRVFESSGAAAIQLEDQTLPKRCGHLSGKTLVSTGEMVGKIKAALDARRRDETLIIARTDGIAVEGFDAALDRARAYADAGADVLFIEAPQTTQQMQAITREFGGTIPLMANMVEGGKTPQKTARELETLGFSLAIFPGGMVRAVAKTMQAYLASLSAHGSNLPFAGNMLDFDQLNGLLGTDDLLAHGAGYDGANYEGNDD
ncbi:MAG: carboxyvinyl-carboxyphosphonate phosphorylmutase [Rhodobacteraceae bacterium]|nr:MAG: carboxyvinyl-carboxyphosphonate phosphorylmutase [Paracoccaceae bacterium]